jgi:hypothetical protein
MKTGALERDIRRAAKAAGLSWTMIREGRNHELWQCGTVQVLISRHRDLPEPVADKVRHDLEPALGKDWWR